MVLSANRGTSAYLLRDDGCAALHCNTVHGIEVVNTIGPGRDHMTSIAQIIEFYKSRVNFAQTSALLFITQCNLFALLFTQ